MIDTWLQQFKDAWQSHNIDDVSSLFDANVEYWETPFKKLETFDDIRSEWSAIDRQSNIELELSTFSEQSNRHTVKWDLTYTNESNEQKHWSGVYLIGLNEIGKCTYFLQVGEQQA